MKRVEKALQTIYNGNPNDVTKEFYIVSVTVKIAKLYMELNAPKRKSAFENVLREQLKEYENDLKKLLEEN